jgi:glycosyltransferase involved in cell wall biosynthesis
MVKNINFVGPFSSFTPSAAGCAAGLALQPNIRLSYVALSDKQNLDFNQPEFQEPIFQSLVESLSIKPDWKDLTIMMLPLHQHELVKCEGPKALISPVYTNVIPEDVKKSLNSQRFEFIGTSSEFGVKVLKEQLPRHKIKHIPFAYKLEPDDKRVERLTPSIVTYWSNLIGYKFPENAQVVSSAGPFNIRKGHDTLLSACLEIGKSRPIVLITSWFHPAIPTGFPHGLAHTLNMEPLVTGTAIYLYKWQNCYFVLLPRAATRKQLVDQFYNTNLYCAPSHCESWNATLFDMMSNGVPCAASSNTAHLDYCNSSNSILMASDKLIKANSPNYLGLWYDIMVDSIVRAINTANVIEDDAVAALVEQAYKKTDEYSWKKTGKLIIEALK